MAWLGRNTSNVVIIVALVLSTGSGKIRFNVEKTSPVTVQSRHESPDRYAVDG